MKVYAVLWLAGLSAVLAPPALACSKAELKTFIAAAQALDAKAVADGQRLVRCPGLSDQAIQWQAFLLDKTGKHEASLNLDEPLVGKSGREGVIARARAGSYQELLHQIDDQDPAFATVAEAQLVLARVLTRKGQFARGREAYQMYLKVRPDDDAAETERLFALIWAGQWAEADAEFRGAQRWSSNPEFKAALLRGQAVIAAHLPTASTAKPQAEDRLGDGELQATYGLYRVPSHYDRRTAAVAYQGLADLRLAAHTIKDLGLTGAKSNANEVAAGATLGSKASWYLSAHGGYFSLGSDHYTGDATLGVPLGAGWMIEGGGAVTPLALALPLSPDAAGLLRDSAFVQLKWSELLRLHLELQKEKGYKPHEAHSFLGRLPLRKRDGDEVAVTLPMSYQSFPQPIADYDTDVRTVTAGAGFSLLRRFAAGPRLNSQASYSLAFVTLRDPAQHTKQFGVFEASADLIVPLDESLHALVTAHYVRGQDDVYVQRHHLVSSLLIGIGYGDSEQH